MHDWPPASAGVTNTCNLRQRATRGMCLVAALVLLSATACGGGGSSATSSGPAGAPNAAGEPAASQAAAAGRADATSGQVSPMVRLLPEKAGGWTRAAVPQRYGPDDLWEYIDGGADQYVSYGFQEVVAAKYSNGAGATATVDVYRMDEPVGAFGIYAQEQNPKATPVRLGVEGQAGADSMRFWSSRYYVKMAATPPGKSSRDSSVALGTAIAGLLGDPGAPPRELGLFPAAGLVAGSIRYVPASILGQAGFARGFEAKYQAGVEASTLVIVPFEDADGARAALGTYRAFLGEGGRPVTPAPTPCDGSVLARDRFYGLIVAARSGTWLAISLGQLDGRAARVQLTEVCAGLARFPAVSSQKAGSR